MNKISDAFPILSEKQLHKESLEGIENCDEEKQFHEESLEIVDIEKFIEEEHSNNMIKISSTLPIPSEKQINKESLESRKNGNCIDDRNIDDRIIY